MTPDVRDRFTPFGDTGFSGINRQDPPSQVPGLCLSNTSGADFDRPTHGGRNTASVEGGEGIPGPARSEGGTSFALASLVRRVVWDIRGCWHAIRDLPWNDDRVQKLQREKWGAAEVIDVTEFGNGRFSSYSYYQEPTDK